MTAKLIRIANTFADALDKAGLLITMDRAELDSAIRDEEAMHGEHARMTAAIVAALVYESDHVDTPEKAPDGDDFNEVMEPLRALLDDRIVFLPAEKPTVTPEVKPLDLETAQRLGELIGRGFTAGRRDPRVNTAFQGAFMVIEPFDESQLPTEDASNGPWAVVGDDLAALINDAYNFHVEGE